MVNLIKKKISILNKVSVQIVIGAPFIIEKNKYMRVTNLSNQPSYQNV